MQFQKWICTIIYTQCPDISLNVLTYDILGHEYLMSCWNNCLIPFYEYNTSVLALNSIGYAELVGALWSCNALMNHCCTLFRSGWNRMFTCCLLPSFHVYEYRGGVMEVYTRSHKTLTDLQPIGAEYTSLTAEKERNLLYTYWLRVGQQFIGWLFVKSCVHLIKLAIHLQIPWFSFSSFDRYRSNRSNICESVGWKYKFLQSNLSYRSSIMLNVLTPRKIYRWVYVQMHESLHPPQVW